MNRAVILVAIAAGLSGAAAFANDSTAETAAGGLVLTRSADIDMISEDLFVSVDRIRVDYVFRNRAPQDVRVTVAFPMPDRDLARLRDADVGFPSDFHTRVDGRPVVAALERHAVVGGTDHTALLESLHILIAPDARGVEPIAVALNALPADQRNRLRGLGLAEFVDWQSSRGPERFAYPLWTVRDTWHWEQVFPAGRDLRVAHDYVPGAGSSAGNQLAYRRQRASAEGRAEIARYCADAGFLAALDRLLRAAGSEEAGLPDYRVGYILTTGGNWRSPIGDFHLVVDKGDPRNVMTFCGQGVRRISPTRFELRRRNWRPDRDLEILIVQPGT